MKLFKKKDISDNVIDISNAANALPFDYSKELVDALSAIHQGHELDLSNIPTEIEQSILTLANSISERNESELNRAIELSINASNSMAAVALITGDIREIESNSNSMAAAIEQLDASIGQISQTAQSSSDKMQNANQLMDEGMSCVRNTNESALVISSTMNKMEDQTKAVVSAVSQIDSFVNIIDEIAAQTNLLALNATIEAARAGDAGKGFAVVASEVKALSRATQKATEGINSRISELNNDVQELLSSFDAANSSVKNTQELTQETENNISSIQDIVNETAGGMANIANLLAEQSQATNELAQGVSKIANNATQAAEQANEAIESVGGSEKVVEEMFDALDGRNIKNYVLNRAKSDHFLWKKNVAAMLVGLNTLKEEALSDHHSCRLGKWVDGLSTDPITQHPAFEKLELPHSEVHKYGKLAAKEFSLGNREASHAAFRNMQQSSDKVVDILNQIISG